MPNYLETFVKQSGETQDYDVDYTDYLEKFEDGDTIQSHTVTVPVGITKVNDSVNGNSVKVWMSGGTSGATYKVTVTITTTLGRVKEADIAVKVKDI